MSIHDNYPAGVNDDVIAEHFGDTEEYDEAKEEMKQAKDDAAREMKWLEQKEKDWREQMTICEICGEIIKDDDIFYDLGDGDPICEGCKRESGHIRPPTRLCEFDYEDGGAER